MDYTVIINNRSYDLPKKTVSVMNKLDDVLKVDNLNIKARQKFEKLHEFVKDILGEANAKEILGSDNLDEIDLQPDPICLPIRQCPDGITQKCCFPGSRH